jgi:hypothetical protein
MKTISYFLETKREENFSFDKKRYLGLCSYCKSELNCMFIRDPKCPVYECEEFEEITYVSIRGPDQKNISSINSSKNPTTREDSLRSYKGLCINCEEKVTCLYPKPEGGVWRCDEYR